MAHLNGISYGDVDEIIQSYFTNRSENWSEIFKEHCSWSGISIVELISGMTSPGGQHVPQSSYRGVKFTRYPLT